MSYKEREGSRMSQNVHTEFVNKKVWEMFKKRFKSHTTEASYWSDITEFCRFCGKKADMKKKGRKRDNKSPHRYKKIQGAPFLF